MINITVATPSYFSHAPTGRRAYDTNLQNRRFARARHHICDDRGCGDSRVRMLILVPSAKEKKVCDQAVNTLFTTTAAIELQREMFLIRRLDCNISTRL
jgi:hypothetical protein